ncbi:DMT family transporter [Paraburkholderia sediminicola]|uniref:DMT family transporter n=1 Tax=Paraburkholderia rhynchosiae TaxID=487049 RepID=A0ACC7N7X8_9BURK
MVRPDGSHSSWLGPALLISSALFGGLSLIQIKRIRATDDSGTTVLYFTAIGTLVTGASLFFAWRTPSFNAFAVMALLGAFATAGQLLMTMAFRQADADTLAPYNSRSIVWAALFGYLFWGETIGAMSLFGVVLIVGSSIAVAVRRKAGRGSGRIGPPIVWPALVGSRSAGGLRLFRSSNDQSSEDKIFPFLSGWLFRTHGRQNPTIRRLRSINMDSGASSSRTLSSVS